MEEELALALAARRFTRPVPPGYARLALPRHATALKARYHLPQDEEDLKALLTVLIWYATEGHGNARNGGIVISSANREELERVKAAYERISDAKGYIHSGSKRDSAWRLYLGAEAIRVLAEHHCGKGATQKRLPDFLFALPRPYLQHAWEELLKTDGSRRLSKEQQKAPRPTGGFMGSSRPFPPCWPPGGGAPEPTGARLQRLLLPQARKSPRLPDPLCFRGGQAGRPAQAVHPPPLPPPRRGRMGLRHRLRGPPQLRLRRGEHRLPQHQRTRVPQAPGQRVHGGPPGPHHQD